jgi:UDP-N-acetylmuramoylalanine--D-glutamate ligase
MAGNGMTRYFSRHREPEYGVYLEDGAILRTKGGNTEKVMKASDILLPGIHNVENYMTAIAVTDGLVSDETVRRVAQTFGGVEHRIELVRVKDGVRFYNDSIASSPSRTIAGLRSFEEQVILIAGGYDKQIPFDVLGPEVCQHVKRLYPTGATARKIYDAVVNCPDYRQGYPEIIMMDDFDETVHRAAASAEAGDVVLLSPACAAFDKFKNFMVRGRHFKKLIMEL